MPLAAIVTGEVDQVPELAVSVIEIALALFGSAFPYGSFPRVTVSFDVCTLFLTVLGGHAENASCTFAAFTWNAVEVPVIAPCVAVSVVEAAALKSVIVAVPTPFVKVTVAGYVGALPPGELAGPVKTIALLPE